MGVFEKNRVLRIIPSLWVCIIVGVIVAAAFCGFVLNKTFVTWFLGQLVFIRDLPQPDFINNFGIGKFPSKSLDNDIYSPVLHYYCDNIQIFKKSKTVGMDICNDTVYGT